MIEVVDNGEEYLIKFDRVKIWRPVMIGDYIYVAFVPHLDPLELQKLAEVLKATDAFYRYVYVEVRIPKARKEVRHPPKVLKWFERVDKVAEKYRRWLQRRT